MFYIENPLSKHTVGAQGLSRNIRCNSEVFYADSRDYVGCLSVKKIIYIASEIADYCLNNYDLRSEKHLKAHRECISLCRMWLDDPGSVSLYDISGAEFLSYNLFHLSDYPSRIIRCIRHVKEDKGNFNRNVEVNFYDVIYAPIYTINHFWKDDSKFVLENAEYRRQGEFIIDFLLSDRSLFM